MKTLVLNSNYMPLKDVNWERALVNTLFKKKNKVYVVQNYKRTIFDTMGREYSVPAVVALSKFVKASSKEASYTKKNIYGRDRYMCQYCGDKFEGSVLTIDHVIPRSRWKKLGDGGKVSCFENAVAACKRCNSLKSDRTCKETNMYPKNVPRAITKMEAFLNNLYFTKKIPDEWLPYLKGFNENF